MFDIMRHKMRAKNLAQSIPIAIRYAKVGKLFAN